VSGVGVGAGVHSAVAALHQRDSACFVIGRCCATLGAQMLAVAVGWQVYALTRDPLALGLVGLSEFLPFILLVLVGGHFADRAPRRAIVYSAYAIEILCALALLLLSVYDVHRTWPIYLTLSMFGVTRAFWGPAMQAMLPGLVTREQFPGAVAVNSMLFQMAVVAGPVIGGLLYLIGAPVVYGSCMTLFAVAALLIVLIRADTRPSAPPELGEGRRFLEGLRFVRHNPLVLGVISLDLFAVLFGGAVALLPIFASDLLHTGPAGLGLLRAAPGVGAALAAAVLALRPLRDHAGAMLLGGVAAFGVCMIVFGLSRSLPLSIAALVLSGAGDMISVNIRGILVPLNTPDALRGRVSAVTWMFIGASNELGEFESGLTASWFGTVPSVVLGGVLTLAVAAVWAWKFPSLRRLRRLR
jgi:MFS family permease